MAENIWKQCNQQSVISKIYNQLNMKKKKKPKFLTLCDPMGCSTPGLFVHGIFQGRILEQIAISLSRGSSQPRDWTHISYKSPALAADSLLLSHQ